VFAAELDELLAGMDEAELGATDEAATDDGATELGATDDAGVELGWIELLDDLEPPPLPPQAANPSVISDRQKTRFACFISNGLIVMVLLLWSITP
jgi:hypothetical protein